MWELTITRKYKSDDSEYEYEDNMYFEVKELMDAEAIINKAAKYAVGGKYEYTIKKKEGEKSESL